MTRVPRTLAYHATGLVTGWLWLAGLVTAWALTAGLLLTLLGVLVFVGLSELVRVGARGEAALARGLLGARVGAPPRHRGLALRERLRDRRLWRAQAFAFARVGVGFPLAVLVLALVADGLGLAVAPLWYWALPDGIELGLFDVDSLPLALAVVPLGLAVAALGAWVAVRTAAPLRRLAEWGLPAGADPAWDAPAERALGAVAWGPVLRWVAGVALVVESVVLVVWAATGRTSPWWAWAAVGLLVPVGLVAVGAAAARLAPGRRRRLATHAGIAGVALLVCVPVWALGGHGTFWPLWPAVGLGALLGLHAVLPVPPGRELVERLERVEASRAGVVDARDDELRRIERDLHDGAQARLVAVAMGLGRAEERLDADPDHARALLLEAQGQARAAIKELRDLARGIAPPVLADRGLVPAIQALAGTSPVPVGVRGDLGDERPPLATERTAYFVVAEALTNAAKHAGPDARVDVTVRRSGDRLEVEVADDGAGGALVGSRGLAGLAQRVEAVDGAFAVDSPPGDGTRVRASLRWPA